MNIRFEHLDPRAADLAGPCAHCDEPVVLLLLELTNPDDQFPNSIEWLCDNERCAAIAIAELQERVDR